MRVRDTNTDPNRNRRTQVWRDQHGRPWEVTIDLEAGTHCTPPIPKFRAPLTPPLEYVQSDPEQLGRLRIAYERWIPEWAAAEAQFNERRLTIASVNYGDAAGSVIERNPVELRRLVGPMPQSAEFPRAALAGNRWVLGIPRPDGRRYPVPPWAEKIGLDRLAPREATRQEIDLEGVRSRYADVDDDGQTIAPLAVQRPARRAMARRDPFAVEVPEGFGAATHVGDDAADFDDEAFGAEGDALYADVDDALPSASYDDAEDDAEDDAPDAMASTHGPMSATMVRTRGRRRRED